MPEVLLILFKINLVLLLFAVAYYLVLRRLTFYTVNRAFLVIGIIFSTGYPFINLSDFFSRQEQINPKVVALMPSIDVNSLIRNPAIIDYWQVIVVLFYIGVTFMAVRLIVQFVSLYQVHNRSTPGTVHNLNVRILDGELSPFSFWQTVYVNPAIHSANELDTILAHEQVHVKEWHTLDIILAEISVVFYWFNPGVWLMKRAIKENIEFITDARIVKRGVDKKAYQYSLLGVGSLQASTALVNHFNLSDLKKRIKMMNAKRSSPKKLAIYALLLPALLITTLAFTVTKKEVKSRLLPLTKVLNNVVLFNEPETNPETVSKKTKRKSNAIRLVHAAQKDTISSIPNAISSSNDSLAHLPELSEVIRLTKNEQLLTTLKGKVKGVKLSTGSIGGIRNISITMKKRDDLPIHANGPSPTEIVVIGYKMKSVVSNTTDSTRANTTKPIVMMNGKPLSDADLDKIKTSEIKSVIIRGIGIIKKQ